jgi:hypothetical protein
MRLYLLAWSESANLPIYSAREPESVAELLEIIPVENTGCSPVLDPVPE